MLMRHLVVRQIFDVRLPSQREAFGVQQRLSRFFWDEAAPALERLFDRLAPGDRMLRIERLEIDLGRIENGALTGEDTLQRLLVAVEEAVRRALHEAGRVQQQADVRGGVFDQWLHFLEHGVLPWYAGDTLPAGWQAAVTEWLGLQAAAAERLRRLLAHDRQALDRLVLQHDAVLLSAVAALLTGLPQQALAEAVAEIAVILSDNTAPKRVSLPAGWSARTAETRLWQWAFQGIAVQRRLEDGAQLAAGFLCEAVPETILSRIAARIKSREGRSHFPALQQIFRKNETLSAILSASKSDMSGKKRQKPARLPSPEAPDTPEDASLDRRPGQAPPARQRGEKAGVETATSGAEPPDARLSAPPPGMVAKPDNRPDAEDSWAVQGAGIVLLNGYWPRFFVQMDLLDSAKQFRDPAARAKAAVLLHYLASGEAEAPEYTLLLPKILCGIPVGQPLDAVNPLTENELEEADTLLRAAIEHWPALGNTSPAGLQEGFLIRPGRLSKRDQGWQLRVERQTIDILLSHAPFAFSVVKLPWTKDILWVDW